MYYLFKSKTDNIKDRTYGALTGPSDIIAYQQLPDDEEDPNYTSIKVHVKNFLTDTEMERIQYKSLITPYIHDYRDYGNLPRADIHEWTKEYIEKYFDARPFKFKFMNLDRTAINYTSNLDMYGWPGNPYTDVMYTDEKNIEASYREFIPELLQLMKDGIAFDELKRILPFKIDTEDWINIAREYGYPHAIDQLAPKYKGDQPYDLTPILDGKIGVERPQRMDAFSISPFKIIDPGMLRWDKKELTVGPIIHPGELVYVKHQSYYVFRRPTRYRLDTGLEGDKAWYEREEWLQQDITWVSKQKMGEKLPQSFFNVPKRTDKVIPIPDDQLYDAAMAIIRVEIEKIPMGLMNHRSNRTFPRPYYPVDLKNKESFFTFMETPPTHDFNMAYAKMKMFSNETENYHFILDEHGNLRVKIVPGKASGNNIIETNPIEIMNSIGERTYMRKYYPSNTPAKTESICTFENISSNDYNAKLKSSMSSKENFHFILDDAGNLKVKPNPGLPSLEVASLDGGKKLD